MPPPHLRSTMISLLESDSWFFSLKDFSDHGRQHLLVHPIAYERLLLEIRSGFSAGGVAVGSKEEQAQHAKVHQLGLLYRNNLMNPVRSNTGPTPASNAHVSRPSFEEHKEAILSAMADAPKTKGNAKKCISFPYLTLCLPAKLWPVH
ncbi:hypothetical protein SERLA73DRAFT_73176 [Serpula lacrymans var. lacrymans S7.3]|uniref:Uncharacterized protein n=2 Tax=Serpula lacrymans var. lacrymans TaxID=341189 RepID=F8PUQ7_SERL3|nr:uncharacterized protein SERLADRAFT_437746 [Serpula lacrymans var. lacrymans S7.9]EGO00465.1 hypothetical protein SERLA73DRAFT_73176 [Serpula lacrymans var. lacrymans S7.3]EGO26016.1 hypothetical protein SERLADRAFT_437746 [Serpula lacrymans var. lacrymans S7.9]